MGSFWLSGARFSYTEWGSKSWQWVLLDIKNNYHAETAEACSSQVRDALTTLCNCDTVILNVYGVRSDHGFGFNLCPSSLINSFIPPLSIIIIRLIRSSLLLGMP